MIPYCQDDGAALPNIGLIKPRELPFSADSTDQNCAQQGSVGLFTGCFAATFDRDPLASTYRVLRPPDDKEWLCLLVSRRLYIYGCRHLTIFGNGFNE